MKNYLLAPMFFLMTLSAMATFQLPVDFHHYLNVLAASDKSVIVQSYAVDNLNVKLRKNVYSIQSTSDKFNEWIEKKSKTGMLRYRISSTKIKGKLMIEYERTESLPDGRTLKFSGTTYIDESGD